MKTIRNDEKQDRQNYEKGENNEKPAMHHLRIIIPHTTHIVFLEPPVFAPPWIN